MVLRLLDAEAEWVGCVRIRRHGVAPTTVQYEGINVLMQTGSGAVFRASLIGGRKGKAKVQVCG